VSFVDWRVIYVTLYFGNLHCSRPVVYDKFSSAEVVGCSQQRHSRGRRHRDFILMWPSSISMIKMIVNIHTCMQMCLLCSTCTWRGGGSGFQLFSERLHFCTTDWLRVLRVALVQSGPAVVPFIAAVCSYGVQMSTSCIGPQSRGPIYKISSNSLTIILR